MFIPGNLWRNPSYRVSHFLCKDSIIVNKDPFLRVEFICIVYDSPDVEADDGLMAMSFEKKIEAMNQSYDTTTPEGKSQVIEAY